MVLRKLSNSCCCLLLTLCLWHSTTVLGWLPSSGPRRTANGIAVKRCSSTGAARPQLHVPCSWVVGNSDKREDHLKSRTHFPKSQLLQMTTTSSNNNEKFKNKPLWKTVQSLVQSGLTLFVTNLWKGLTLPFPKLGSLLEKERQQNNRSLGVTESLLFIAIYLVVGVGAYTYFLPSHWSVVDALYFCVVSFTTVGYGDLTPLTPIGKIFTIVFALGGVAFLGVALATLGSNLVQAELVALEQAQKASRSQIMEFFQKMPHIVQKQKLKGDNEALREVSKIVTTASLDDGDNDEHTNSQNQKTNKLPPKSKKREILEKVIPFIVSLSLGGIAIGRMEGWSWWDSIYFSMITASTVGYGDLCPTLPHTRLLSVVLLPVAVAAAGDVLGSIASLCLERLRHLENASSANKNDEDLTMERIELMDTNGDGRVSKREYIEFMLLEMNLVDQTQLDELHDQFETLDASRSGFLDKEDIEIMARLRRRQQQQQLEADADDQISNTKNEDTNDNQ